MNSDIQIIDVLSEDDAGDCCPNVCSGDKFMDTVFVTVIAVGMAEIVTTVLTVTVFVNDSTSVLVLVVSFVFVMTDVVTDVVMDVVMGVVTEVVTNVVVDVVLITCELIMTDVMVLITAQNSVKVTCLIRQLL